MNGTARPPPPNGSGWHIGPYRVEGELGRGGMGTVYRVTDTASLPSESYALKTLTAPSDQALERFEEEAKVLAALNHPNILRLREFHRGTHRRLSNGSLDSSYFVTELIAGGTLEQLIQASASAGSVFSASPLLPFRIGAQISAALSVVHQKGIAHRDLKPSNVMLAGSPEEILRSHRVDLKLVDFGIAYSDAPDRPELTTVGVYLGTPLFAAPEQLEALFRIYGMGTQEFAQKARAEHASRDVRDAQRADLFSLGMILYQLLVGTHLYDASSCKAPAGSLDRLKEYAALLQQGLDSLRMNPPACVKTSGLESLLLSLLAREPGARPTADAVRQELTRLEPLMQETLLEGRTIRTRSPSQESKERGPVQPSEQPSWSDSQVREWQQGPMPEPRASMTRVPRLALLLFAVAAWGAWSVWTSQEPGPNPPESFFARDARDHLGGEPPDPVEAPPSALPEPPLANEKPRPATPRPEQPPTGGAEPTAGTGIRAQAQKAEPLRPVPGQDAAFPSTTRESVAGGSTSPVGIAADADPIPYRVPGATPVRAPRTTWILDSGSARDAQVLDSAAGTMEVRIEGRQAVAVRAFADGMVLWSEPRFMGLGKPEACLQVEDARRRNLIVCGLEPGSLLAEGTGVQRGDRVANAPGGSRLLLTFFARESNGRKPLPLQEWLSEE